MAIGLVRGQRAELMVVTAISLVVAAVPESLPAVVTLASLSAHGGWRPGHALIRRLPAVETLGSVTVLATDKTGTLTEGEMVVRRLWTPDDGEAITGAGYDPVGAVDRPGRPVTARDARPWPSCWLRGALCNDAELRPPGGDQEPWTTVGDPTEGGPAGRRRQLRPVPVT